MVIQVECSCGKRFNVRDEWADQEVKCQVCGAMVLVEKEESGEPVPSLSADKSTVSEAQDKPRRCEFCDEEIPSKSIVCPFCRENV